MRSSMYGWGLHGGRSTFHATQSPPQIREEKRKVDVMKTFGRVQMHLIPKGEKVSKTFGMNVIWSQSQAVLENVFIRKRKGDFLEAYLPGISEFLVKGNKVTIKSLGDVITG